MSGLTLFTWPKSFSDPLIARIQRNAVRSWLKLHPQPAILVFGNEPGTAEYCAEFGVRHIRDEMETIHGAVTLRDLANKAETLSDTAFYCFVNADIILTNDLLAAVDAVSKELPDFLLGGSPWNLEVPGELDFDAGWENDLKRRALEEGELRGYNCSDFFVYRKGYMKSAPPLLIGRNHVDNGMMWFTRNRGAALVDGTTGAICVHQNHHYKHIGGQQVRPRGGREELWNEQCVGGRSNLFTWANATHHYTSGGVQPYLAGRLWRWGLFSTRNKVIYCVVWGPIARLTRPLRRLLGWTNPRSAASAPDAVREVSRH
jgi:hypothetical protein